MIQSLKTKNFQSHRDSELLFAPGVNVITGTSDSGKTAILRSLYWIIYNRPRGKAFIRDGTTEAQVAVDVGETTIVRKRGKENTYTVGGEVLEAMGADVPQQVTDALNIGELNVQRQLDGHFLILDSPGKIAEAINRVTHLEDASKVADNLSAGLREGERERKEDEAKAEALEVELAGYAGLDSYEERLKAAVGLDEATKGLRDRTRTIRSLLVALAEVEDGLKSIALPEGLADELEIAQGLSVEVSALKARIDSIADTAFSLGEVKADLSKLPKVDRAKMERAGELLDGITDLRALVKWLRDWRNDYLSCGDKLEEASEDIEGWESDYHDLLAQVKNCPACGSELNEESRAKLLEGDMI